MQAILTFIPTHGPFGSTIPGGVSGIDVAIDAFIIVVIAHGVRKGFRAAWIVSIGLGVFNLVLGAASVVLLAIDPVAADEIRDDLSLAAASA